jgi:hypothetical protein
MLISGSSWAGSVRNRYVACTRCNRLAPWVLSNRTWWHGSPAPLLRLTTLAPPKRQLPSFWEPVRAHWLGHSGGNGRLRWRFNATRSGRFVERGCLARARPCSPGMAARWRGVAPFIWVGCVGSTAGGARAGGSPASSWCRASRLAERVGRSTRVERWSARRERG